MKFLVDESVEYRIAQWLRQHNYDTIAISEISPSIPDTQVLQKAKRENRILITNDKDFGELIYQQKLPHKGVIFFRLSEETAQAKIKILELLLYQHQTKLKNHFITITPHKIRIRKI